MTGAGVICEVGVVSADYLVASAHAGGEPTYRTIRRPGAGLSRLLLDDLMIAGSDAPIFRAAANRAYRLASADLSDGAAALRGLHRWWVPSAETSGECGRVARRYASPAGRRLLPAVTSYLVS